MVVGADHRQVCRAVIAAPGPGVDVMHHDRAIRLAADSTGPAIGPEDRGERFARDGGAAALSHGCALALAEAKAFQLGVRRLLPPVNGVAGGLQASGKGAVQPATHQGLDGAVRRRRTARSTLGVPVSRAFGAHRCIVAGTDRGGRRPPFRSDLNICLWRWRHRTFDLTWSRGASTWAS